MSVKAFIDTNIFIYTQRTDNPLIYDCLMFTAAIYAGCQILISEDMQDGMSIEDNIKIVNIFKHPNSFFLRSHTKYSEFIREKTNHLSKIKYDRLDSPHGTSKSKIWMFKNI